MFAKIDAQGKQTAFESVLGKGTEIKGTLRSKSSMRIDGTVEGTVECDGDITAGESAVLNANLTAKNVTISGALVGKVMCSGRLELMPTAKVKGDIKAGKLVISEGAVFTGATDMGDPSIKIPAQTGDTKATEK